MTDNEFNQYISETVSKVMQDNIMQILEMFATVTGKSESSVQDTALAFTSVTLATKLSTAITLEMLKKFGILNLSNFDFAEIKPDLQVILGNLKTDE